MDLSADSQPDSQQEQGRERPIGKRRKSVLAWRIVLRIDDDEDYDCVSPTTRQRDCKYVVEEIPTWDGVSCPRTKPSDMGQDEKQETHNHPGWWFLLKQRNYRPIRIKPHEQQFPCTGRQRVLFHMLFDRNVIWKVEALLDFVSRPLQGSNAKIHLDKVLLIFICGSLVVKQINHLPKFN